MHTEHRHLLPRSHAVSRKPADGRDWLAQPQPHRQPHFSETRANNLGVCVPTTARWTQSWSIGCHLEQQTGFLKPHHPYPRQGPRILQSASPPVLVLVMLPLQGRINTRIFLLCAMYNCKYCSTPVTGDPSDASFKKLSSIPMCGR
jgi:hypothetical protein